MGQDGATALDTTHAGVLTTVLGLLSPALCSGRAGRIGARVGAVLVRRANAPGAHR